MKHAFAWMALTLAGCAEPIATHDEPDSADESTGDDPEAPTPDDPEDTAGPDRERFVLDCETLPLPEVERLEYPVAFRPLHVSVPMPGFTLDPANPPNGAAVHTRYRDDLHAWLDERMPTLADAYKDTWLTSFTLNEENQILVACTYFASCREPICTDDDLWDEHDAPRYENMFGWIQEPIELHVW